MTDERTRCPAPECGAYDDHHIPGCPLAPLEYKAEMMLVYYKKWLEERAVSMHERQRLRDLATLWQGKHAMLRHENNRLRRKLKNPRTVYLVMTGSGDDGDEQQFSALFSTEEKAKTHVEKLKLTRRDADWYPSVIDEEEAG